MNDFYKKYDGTWYDDETIVVYFVAKSMAGNSEIFGDDYFELEKLCFDIYNDTSEKHMRHILKIMDRIISTNDSIFAYASPDRHIFTFANDHVNLQNDIYDECKSLVFEVLRILNIVDGNPFKFTAFFIKCLYLMKERGYMISTIEKIHKATNTDMWQALSYIRLLERMNYLYETSCDEHLEAKCFYEFDTIYYLSIAKNEAEYAANNILDQNIEFCYGKSQSAQSD